MAAQAMGTQAHDWLKAELPGGMSREAKTALSGQTLKNGQICITDANGKRKVVAATGNETHTYTFTGTPTAGTFRVTLWHKDGYWVETTDIAFDASEAVFDAAVEAVLGTSAVTGTLTGEGSGITVLNIVFGGTGYASLTQPEGFVDWSKLVGVTASAFARATSAGAAKNEVQTFDFGAAATAGTIKIGVTTAAGSLVWTDTAAWSATDATFLSNINAVLDQIAGTGGIVATAKAATDTDSALVFTFSGTGYAALAQPALQLDTSALTSVTTVTFTRTTAGGKAGNQVGNKASCVAYDALDASAADVEGVFITRDARVDRGSLYFGGGDPDGCIAALAEVGIIVETSAGKFEPGV